MTRRAMPLLGALASAFLLMAAVPAAAAEGFLIVGDEVHPNPSGCLKISDVPDFLDVINQTTGTAVVFATDDCTGSETAVLAPGALGSLWGASISIVEAP
ncbi:hypothetical protein [Streptomyces sp. NPDC014894]|uniref:hypothetical protein n=1 Tax=unclassified Streptomyces TaxID=2593676 RepID=UPI0036F7D62B